MGLEFFASILSIFSQCTACLDVGDGDQAELLSRRLEQYEETLRVMYQRITESRPDQGALRCDIEQLLNALRRTLERLESLYCDNEENDYEDITTGSSAGILSPAYSGLVRIIRLVCLRADMTGSNLCKAAIIRCLCILHPLDCKAR